MPESPETTRVIGLLDALTSVENAAVKAFTELNEKDREDVFAYFKWPPSISYTRGYAIEAVLLHCVAMHCTSMLEDELDDEEDALLLADRGHLDWSKAVRGKYAKKKETPDGTAE